MSTAQTAKPANIARIGFTERDLARFLAKISIETPCWRWTGGHNGGGYGQFHKQMPDGRRTHYAHRLVYELFVGPISEGMTMDHTCENGSGGCVTPNHLRVATPRENVIRGDTITGRKSRQTHCIHGHPLSGENLYVYPDGRRACRACKPINRPAWKSAEYARAAYWREKGVETPPPKRRYVKRTAQ